MSDLRTPTDLVSNDVFDALRAKPIAIDTKSKTQKWLQSQIHERCATLEAYKGQIANLEGLMECKEDELKQLQENLKRLLAL